MTDQHRLADPLTPERRVVHVDRAVLARALAAADDLAARYWCWVRDEYERADALRVELSALLGQPRNPQPWP